MAAEYGVWTLWREAYLILPMKESDGYNHHLDFYGLLFFYRIYVWQRTRTRLQLSVKWGNRHVVETSFYRFDVSWLKEKSLRGLLAHVMAMINSNRCLDDVEEITVNVMQHVNECDSSGVSRKRPCVKIIATSLLDDEVYDVMVDLPTRQFAFTHNGNTIQERLNQFHRREAFVSRYLLVYIALGY